jgi:bifunctional DNA-binding transcriptional regulator/antitoxin component of YhaV-PrlF toxin-antitoxin module
LPLILANGNLIGMNIRIDKTGRLVLPKSLRSQYGITPETELELIPSADGLLLRRVAERPSLQRIDGLWVHQGSSTATTPAAWAGAIDGVRDERAGSGWKVG